jgi:hypothetical protein
MRLAVMSAKNPNTESAHTILRRRDGAYVVVRDEGDVTRICRLRVVRSNPRAHLVEPDRAPVVLEATIADEAAIMDAATLTGVTPTAYVAAITDVTTLTGVSATTDAAEDAHDIPDLKSAATEPDWSMRRARRAIEDPLER